MSCVGQVQRFTRRSHTGYYGLRPTDQVLHPQVLDPQVLHPQVLHPQVLDPQVQAPQVQANQVRICCVSPRMHFVRLVGRVARDIMLQISHSLTQTLTKC